MAITIEGEGNVVVVATESSVNTIATEVNVVEVAGNDTLIETVTEPSVLTVVSSSDHVTEVVTGASTDPAAGFTWRKLVIQWTEIPVETTYSGGDGKVFIYVYGLTTYYRFVPAAYDPNLDIFYSTYDDPALSGVIATRGVSI
jgi:hypothetical protein